jgi:hypothetical protein
VIRGQATPKTSTLVAVKQFGIVALSRPRLKLASKRCRFQFPVEAIMGIQPLKISLVSFIVPGRGCFVNRPLRYDEVDAPNQQRLCAFAGCVDDGLRMHVEARVNEDRNARLAAKCSNNVVIKRVGITCDRLWSCRAVHMNHGRDALAPGGPHRT